MQSQELIYNERYRHSSYDERSVARVLTAESTALRRATHRALRSHPDHPVTLLDFGYGTGRVTNEFLLEYQDRQARPGRDLSVVAYDVSVVGLQKAAGELAGHGFTGGASLHWQPRKDAGHVIGSIRREAGGTTVAVTFVHGSEAEPAGSVQDLLLEANGRQPYLVTTSWYSAIGHIYGSERRRQFFVALGDLTLPSGEFLVAVAATGDLVDAQQYWSERLAAGAVGDRPIECDGDVVYLTELDQENYWHVFSADLAELLDAICTDRRQHGWIEAVRFPDDEFATLAAEQANYAKVREFNRAKAGTAWTEQDFRAVHTVAAMRSGTPSPPARATRPRKGACRAEEGSPSPSER